MSARPTEAPAVRLDAADTAPRPPQVAELLEGPYRVRFAETAADVEAALRLRFSVFNGELGEGLEGSWETGLDADRFDALCHHLLLEERATGRLIGTYRMQTYAMARQGIGFYCSQEFDLSTLPEEVLSRSVELGRACIAREHRNGLALFALWRGLAAYLVWSGAELLFGCCSLTTTDPRDGARMMHYLERGGYVSEELRVQPLAECACDLAVVGADEVAVPRLFATYLRYGSKVLGPPALDRDFGTIDFFIVLDVTRLARRLYAMFFSGLGGADASGRGGEG